MANNKNAINHTELVWNGKFSEELELPPKRLVDQVSLPFQTIEVINEPREETRTLELFGDQKKEGWRNKLIWGDNKLVTRSLLKEYAGKINLIYIDPPFFTGTDQKIVIKAGDGDAPITKEPSMIEEAAYRNIWKQGAASYFDWIWERLNLMRELLSNNGIIFIRHDQYWSHYIKVVADEVFGRSNFQNEIVVKRIHKNVTQQGRISIPIATDSIFVYFKTSESKYFDIYKTLDKNRESYWRAIDDSAGLRNPPHRIILGKTYYPPAGKHFKFGQEKINKMLDEGRIRINSKTGRPQYLVLETSQAILDSDWTDISSYSFKTGYPTENSEDLLERVIKAGSEEGDLIADFFCGSGTTGAVGEKLGRRWIMCDLGRFAIHTSRKRLMEVQRILKDQSKPYSAFEILNLGKYERQHWQATLTKGESNKDTDYIKFITELYKAEVLNGFINLHGKKNGHAVHIGAVDAPVTMTEIMEALQECRDNKLYKLDVLGWEWEMSVNEEAIKNAKGQGIELRLLQIPKEVMEPQAVEKGEVRFFELDHMAIDIERKDKKIRVKLVGFAIPSEDLIPDELREKITNWPDYVDYWSVDWDYESLKGNNSNTIFENNWQSFRSKQQPKLELETSQHEYQKKGKYSIAVKAIDIFGNDTSKVVEITIK